MGALFGLNICVFFITLEYVSIAVALIIGALTPVVALPIAVVFMGERLTALKVVCALAAVAGVVGAILASPPSDDGGDSVVGYLWAVGALLVWVAYLLASKKVRREVETVRMMWCISVSGALTVTVLALVVQSDLGEMQGTDWLWVVLLALGPGLLGHGLFVWAATPCGLVGVVGAHPGRAGRCVVRGVGVPGRSGVAGPGAVDVGRAGGARRARLPRGARRPRRARRRARLSGHFS